MLKKYCIYTIVLILIIQLIRPTKNTSTAIQTNNISSLYNVPESTQLILKKACYDCHSNNTRYPWYAQIQPVSYWLSNHILAGKEELNFDEFATYKLRKQYHKLEEIITQVYTEKVMPMDSYTWMHADAKLSDNERELIANWVTSIQDTLKANNPIDSLIRKKP
jgi:hypothetical protein